MRNLALLAVLLVCVQTATKAQAILIPAGTLLHCTADAKRDVVEWLFPPLWPWKVIMLPARGPHAKLKNEQQFTLKLMNDVELPQLTAYSSLSPSRPYGYPQANATPQVQSYPRRFHSERDGSVCHSDTSAWHDTHSASSADHLSGDGLLDRWPPAIFCAARRDRGVHGLE